MDYYQNITKASNMIESAKNLYALTGAGVSTESGIPDFRTPGKGLWEKINPMETATMEAFEKDPEFFWHNNFKRWEQVLNASPNDAHYALAILEKHDYLKGIITQNIDGLHYKAGSKNVLEVHGHLRSCRCLKCGKHFAIDLIIEQYKNGYNPPCCPECPGLLRPDVVLFGDPMADDFFKAEKLLADCDVLLVVGTSLQVYPVAALPQLAEKLIIINLMDTPFNGEVEIKKAASVALRDILKELKLDVEPE